MKTVMCSNLKRVVAVLLLLVIFTQFSLAVHAESESQVMTTESSAMTTALPTQTSTNLTNQATANSYRHEYTIGIYDGTVYRLRNVAHGTYMDVDNEGTDSCTNISTYVYNGKLNQQFKFQYKGSNLYEMIPMNSPQTYVRVAESGAGSTVEIYEGSSTKSTFKAVPIGSGKYILLSQASNFTCAICFDTGNPNNVVQKNYESLSESDKRYAQWYLECVDINFYDSYEKYYIYNVNTGLYLDVVERGDNLWYYCACPPLYWL